MAKIRTLSHFVDAANADFAWRKKELAKVKSMVYGSRNRTIVLRSSIRFAIPILYAHWEGLVKNVGTHYCEYVFRQRLLCSQLSDSFLAATAHKLAQESMDSGKVSATMDLVSFLRDEQGKRASFRWESMVNTRSNLSSEVLKDILLRLGLNFDLFETKSHFIDSKLVRNRNTIAHGEYLLVDFPEYEEIHNVAFQLMQSFFDLVCDAAVDQKYLRHP